jgi:activator of 2-hydroxyglutaryl-CoA dehydratase
MATTTNFGWSTPDDTSLVKDGAAAIRTLGQSIDTSMMDLEGGTTGQVLSKASNTDMDFTWVTTDDANAIQNAIVDAKGDLIAATAADTPARLAVGTNGHVLTADSTAATGLAWAAPAGGLTFAGASVYKSAAQSIPNDTLTTVTWNSEDFDTNSFHSTATNTGRFTIPTAGKYLINAMIGWDTTGSTTTKTVTLRKNGADLFKSNGLGTGSDYQSQSLQYIFSAAVNDYFEILCYQTTGAAVNILQNANSTYQISYLGA